jgi:hypothetical protein
MKELPFDPYDFFGYIASGLVLVTLAQLIFGFPKVFGADLKLFDTAAVVLAVYVAGQLVAGPAKLLFEDLLVHKVLQSPTRNLLRSDDAPLALKIFFPGFYTPLPPLVRAQIASKLSPLDPQQKNAEEVFLNIRYNPDVLSNDRLMAKIDMFRDQYGFARNVSFSLLIAAISLGITAHIKGDRKLVHYTVAASIAGILLLYRFLKFYRQYSYELFNSYAQIGEKGTS